MKIQLKSYLQFKFHATGVIFTMVTMFPHFPPKCGACVNRQKDRQTDRDGCICRHHGKMSLFWGAKGAKIESASVFPNEDKF